MAFGSRKQARMRGNGSDGWPGGCPACRWHRVDWIAGGLAGKLTPETKTATKVVAAFTAFTTWRVDAVEEISDDNRTIFIVDLQAHRRESVRQWRLNG